MPWVEKKFEKLTIGGGGMIIRDSRVLKFSNRDSFVLFAATMAGMEER